MAVVAGAANCASTGATVGAGAGTGARNSGPRAGIGVPLNRAAGAAGDDCSVPLDSTGRGSRAG